MDKKSQATLFAKEIEMEYRATQKCLERIPETLYGYKPHPKSMELGFLVLLVAEIPNWIVHIVKAGVVDFATYKRFELSTTEAMLTHFEECYLDAVETLQHAEEKQLEGDFKLQQNGKVLDASPKMDAISSAINHWVHHRGQLTVYMRLNDIAVPSIYGPSADEKTF